MIKTIALVVGFSAILQISAGSLRSVSSQDSNEDTISATATLQDTIHGYGGATFYINHVASASGWDDQVVVNSFIKAYNDVFSGGDRTITSAFIDNSIVLPEGGSGTEQLQADFVVGRRQTADFLDQGWTYYDSISWCKFQYGKL